jgi:hypothetical protein
MPVQEATEVALVVVINTAKTLGIRSRSHLSAAQTR